MMKQTVYSFLILCLIFFPPMLKAQQVECDRDFEIKAEITPSTCMANGIITVTLEGDLANLDMDRAEYGLEPVAGTFGTSLLPSANHILRGIAPGTYTLSIRTFCKVGDQYGRVKELLNLKVEGTYKPLMADYDQARSRKSYKDCATGIIAFNITTNTGYGDLKFHMTQAPPGVSLSEIFPTAGTAAGRYVPYTLSDLYPPGQYQIDIDDDCGKSTISFTLGEITDLPSYSFNYGSFSRPTSLGPNCNVVRWSSSTPNSSSAPDYYRYYIDKMYEVALVPAGVTPSESDWRIWSTSPYADFTLPGDYSDYHTANSLEFYFRLRGCDKNTKGPLGTYLKSPIMSMGSSFYFCDYYTYYISSYVDYDNFWCYPLNVKITNTTDNSVVYDEMFGGPSLSLSDIQLIYGKQHSIEIKGANDISYSRTSLLNFVPSIALTVSTYKCNTFTGSLYFSSGYRCYPVDVDVYRLKDGGNTSIADDFEFFESHTFEGPSGYSKSVDWGYGSYKLVATFKNHIIEGKPYTSTILRDVPANRPTAYTLSTTSHSSCSEDQVSLYVRSSAPSSSTYFPAGTTFTVVEAPLGYALLDVPYKYTSSSTACSFNSTNTPAGRYKVKVDDGCGQPVYVEAELNGGYSARNTQFVVETHGCEGERLKLEGLVTNAGNNQAGYTYYKIINGPKGFDSSPRRYNETILLTSDGDYDIGVMTSITGSCYLKREVITYKKSKPTLDPSTTSSYVCTDRSVGYIIVSGQNGTEPYRYDLLNEDKSSTGAVATDAGDGRFYFDYGVAGQSFFVRITDACDNSNDQEVKLTDLKTQRIIYNTPPSGEYCLGDTVKLNCITLGETTYLWRGPNGFESTEQSPRLYPATEAMTGYYSVSVMPEFCGESVTDQLYIKVFPELVINAVSSDQDICVATRATTMSCTTIGGKGLHKYQWQSSRDKTNWTDIQGANRATYTPAVFTKSGPYYYRLQITDDCKMAFSDVITLNVRACYIMVNPNIRSKVF